MSEDLQVQSNGSSVQGSPEAMALWRLEQIIAVGSQFVSRLEGIAAQVSAAASSANRNQVEASNGFKQWYVAEARNTYQRIAESLEGLKYDMRENGLAMLKMRGEHEVLCAALLRLENKIDGARPASRKRASARVAPSTKRKAVKKRKRG